MKFQSFDHTLSILCVLLSFIIGAIAFGEGMFLYAVLGMLSALAFFTYAKHLEDPLREVEWLKQEYFGVE
jgi:hypothetical protein